MRVNMCELVVGGVLPNGHKVLEIDGNLVLTKDLNDGSLYDERIWTITMIDGDIVDITSNGRRYCSTTSRCMDVTIVLRGFTSEPNREDILKQLANDLQNDVSAYVMVENTEVSWEDHR